MKRVPKVVLGVAAACGVTVGGLYVSGWFDADQVAKRELENRGVSLQLGSVAAASNDDDVELLELLGTAEVRLDAPDDQGDTPLHIAIQRKRWKAAGYLVKHVTDRDVVDKDGLTALAHAFDHDHLPTAKALLKAGANPNATSSSGDPLLIHWIKAKRPDISDLLISHKADPNLANTRNETPLCVAIEKGAMQTVDALLAAGANANAITPNGEPVLHHLCSNIHDFELSNEDAGALVKTLIAAGASANAPNEDGQLPIHLAIRSGMREAIDILMGSTESLDGCSWLALEQRDFSMFRKFIQRGAPIDEPRMDGETPLALMVREKNAHMVDFILSHGADPDQVTREGQRVLCLAIVTGDFETTATLLNHENGAAPEFRLNDPVSKDFLRTFYNPLLNFYMRHDSGLTPMFMATALRQHDTVKLLIEKGANRTAWTTRAGSAPVQLAAKTRDIPLQQILLGVEHSDTKQQRRIVVNLRTQRAVLYQGKKAIASSPISSGRKGFRTPSGKFVITDKNKDHKSNIYDSAPMPYFMRLSCAPFGLHAGDLPGYPASHGCIRMPHSNARYFFSKARVGDRVTITK